ncbi:MAG: hypothetical protein M5U29_12545 [Anaerolineae bacterium]|nr:hypothetical protein [Anaerolineae bacterium]
MSAVQFLERILAAPTADDLWALHPHLLALQEPEAERARDVLRLFYCYMSCVTGKLTSKEHSSSAAHLAAGSVGVIALHEVLESLAADRARAISNLLSGGLAATLETLSTFQHVKAWEREFASVHEEAVWHLYRLLWELSSEAQPDLPFDRRRALIDGLLAVIRSDQLEAGARVAVVIRLFQVLLAIRVAPLLDTLREREALSA